MHRMNIPFSLGLINFIMKNSSLYLQMKLSIIEIVRGRNSMLRWRRSLEVNWVIHYLDWGVLTVLRKSVTGRNASVVPFICPYKSNLFLGCHSSLEISSSNHWWNVTCLQGQSSGWDKLCHFLTTTYMSFNTSTSKNVPFWKIIGAKAPLPLLKWGDLTRYIALCSRPKFLISTQQKKTLAFSNHSVV